MMSNNNERDYKIIQLYLEGLSQKEIGNKLFLTQSGVSYILRKNNIYHKQLHVDEEYFQEINSNEKAYWLGYICADGHINQSNGKLHLSSKDQEIIFKFKNAINSEHAISHEFILDKRTNKSYERYVIQITNKFFVFHILKYLTNKKSDILEMPLIDEKYYSYFFAGLFDGDGSISFKKNGYPVANLISTKEILYFLMKYLNIEGTLQKVTKKKKNIWKLYFYSDIRKFLPFIYHDSSFSYLQRKYEKYKEFLKWQPIRRLKISQQ